MMQSILCMTELKLHIQCTNLFKSGLDMSWMHQEVKTDDIHTAGRVL